MTLSSELEDVAQAALDEYSCSIGSKQVPGIFNDATALGEGATVDLNHGATGGNMKELGPLCVDYERLEGLSRSNGSLAVARVEEGVERSFQLLFEHSRKDVSGKVRLFERDGEVVGKADSDDIVYRGSLFDVECSGSFARGRFLTRTEDRSPWFQSVTAKLLGKACYDREIAGDLGLLDECPTVATDHSGHQAASLECGKGVAQRHSADPKGLRELSFWGKFGSCGEATATDGFEQVVLDLLVRRNLRLSTQRRGLRENC